MRKLKNNKGFTLIEMLIVVAIIAILIAVSIPLVNQALERARESTDAANERSFKAELVISYLSETDVVDGGTADFAPDTIYAYDAVNGQLVSSVTGVDPYGKSTTVNVIDTTPRTGHYLFGLVDENGNVSMVWATAMPTDATDVDGSNLLSPDLITTSVATPAGP